MKQQRKILILEPYFGGSHRAFLEGLLACLPCNPTLLTLPARKWKMRMQLSAPWFVEQIQTLPVQERQFEAVLCSTFVDVAVFRALASRLDGWNREARICTYFHENQFAYPGQVKDSSINQFTAINFTSALASDRIAFNSSYNRNSFLEQSQRYVKKAADMRIDNSFHHLSRNSVVLHPGIDFTLIDTNISAAAVDQPVIVWNHRWEHDKNPERFFKALLSLKQSGFDFRLILLGESFTKQPRCFFDAQEVFKEEIIHCGYASSRAEYASLLKKGDVVISTAFHEFFGISILEAVRAGCVPVLPNRLSYPELFSEKFLYEDNELETKIVEAVKRGRLSGEERQNLTQKYDWQNISGEYERWLFAEEQ